MSIEAYPLTWPDGYARTPASRRNSSRFDQTFDKAQRFLHLELSRLGATETIVSTNLRFRRDGLLYADELNRKIDDPGVAIYFKYKKKNISMCCDQYSRVWENIYALGKGIEALRGMERWGVSDFLERAFTGFAALPPSITTPYKRAWWEVLGVAQAASRFDIREAYIELAKIHHPDAGGTAEVFQELVNAYQEALS